MNRTSPSGLSSRRPLRLGASASPRVTASAAAGASEPSSSSQAPAASIKPQLSFRQQARSFEARTRDAQRAIVEGFLGLPPVKAALSLYDQILIALQPYLTVLMNRWDKFYENYCEFCSEEVKRAWRFKRQYEPEEAFWANAIHFVNICAIAIVWELAVPVSFLWAIALPMYLNWILYEDFWKPWKSPITAALLIVAPFKFPLWATWAWI